MTVRLLRPSAELLPGYVAALETGWSPDNTRPEAARDERDRIARDRDGFLRSLDDPEARGGPILLPDGSREARLPSRRWWIWEDGFCGTIGLRWQRGTPDLPPHVLGHAGYAVVPWRRRRGVATAALAMLLPEARAVGLPWITVTANEDNLVSQRVIVANGGVFLERFREPDAYGAGWAFRYRIPLPSPVTPGDATG